MGFYPGWAWSWPLNRRVMYNRASADLDGKPWDPARPGIQWDSAQKKWVGDVPDYPRHDGAAQPQGVGPVHHDRRGRRAAVLGLDADGPFPEHYEPMESPIDNPLHPNQSASPVAFLYDKAAGRRTGSAPPRTTRTSRRSYRLTEHEHYVTQHVPHLVAAAAGAVRGGAGGAWPSEKGIKTGDRVRVSSKRGKLEVRGDRHQAAGSG